jgi:HK97 family phage portal protein
VPKRKPGLVGRALTWLHHHRFLNLQGVQNWGSGGGWNGSWWPGAILESFAGAWQQNVVVAPTNTLLSFSPIYAAITGIAQDIGKCRVMLMQNSDGIWEELTANQPWLPLLRKPNDFQDRIKFFEHWMLSKLMYGNTYILKKRDDRTVVNGLYVLHPGCIKPLVAENGDVYYEITRDDLAGITDDVLMRLHERYGRTAIPASEIIHDRMNCLWHPLVGVSPLYACGSSASLGIAIQTNSTKFYQNKSMPGGMLTAPGEISEETAGRLKATFEQNFSGDNIGKLLVVGDGLEFKAFALNAEQSQTKEQFEQAVDDCGRAFRYPRWKLGGAVPPYTKPDQAQTMYYTDCLGPHIEAIELCLDNGLELPLGMGTEFDLDSLMRMDVTALYESINAGSNWLKINEQRRRANYRKLPIGGDTVYRQEQDHSIEALAKRDAKDDPFSTSKPATTPKPQDPPVADMPAEDMPMDPPDPGDREYRITAADMEAFERQVSEEIACP